MTVQIKINPETGFTECGNNVKKETTGQLLFSTVHTQGLQGYAFGIPNTLYNAEQLLCHSMTKKNDGNAPEWCYDPHIYWGVDHRPEGCKQIIDSGLFTYLYGGQRNATLKEVERYADYYMEFVNNHFGKHCFTKNTPWFVELGLHGRFPMEDYHRIQQKMFDTCPNRDFIGVWHGECGLKQLDEVCERFDYVSLSFGKGWNWDIVWGAIGYIEKKYPGKCIHLLGTSSFNTMAWGGIIKHIDTFDCTTWAGAKRFGLSPKITIAGVTDGKTRGDLVKPAEMFLNDNLFKLFPRTKTIKKDIAERDPISQFSKTNREANVWTLCKVYEEWVNASLFGGQKVWENGPFRNVIIKTLQGKGAELTQEDIGKPLYDMEFVENFCDSRNDFYFPVDTEKGWHYKDKFDKNCKFMKSM